MQPLGEKRTSSRWSVAGKVFPAHQELCVCCTVMRPLGTAASQGSGAELLYALSIFVTEDFVFGTLTLNEIN